MNTSMNLITRINYLTSNCLHDFGIEVDPIELMHWILIGVSA